MHRKVPSMPWRARFLLIAALLSAPGMAQALGLGKLTLHSGLDEPLSADIQLTSVNPAELKSLRTGLAPRAEFEDAGIDWMPLLSNIKYNVVKQPDGSYTLHLTSDQPIREPFLHFLLQADWVGGHLIREYTALLDPPYLAESKPPTVEAPEVAAPGEVPAETLAAGTPDTSASPDGKKLADAGAEKGTENMPAPTGAARATAAPAGTAQMPAGAVVTPNGTSTPAVAAVVPNQAEGDSEPETDNGSAALGPDDSSDETGVQNTNAEKAPTDAEWATVPQYGPVKKGDTLYRIADRVRSDKGLSVEQVMMALLKANRSAFVRNNVNNLKTGRILKLPEREQIQSISKAQAAKAFRAQYDAWQEYKLRVAAARRAIKVDDTAVKATAKGAIAAQASGTTAKTEKPATANSSGDLLKIVRDNLADGKGAKGEGGKAAGANEQKRLADKVATLEEAIESRELENKELRDRVNQLEAQLKNTKRLVEIENSQFALAQKQAGGEKAPVSGANTPPAAAAKTVPTPTPVPVPVAPKAPTAAPTQQPSPTPAAPAVSAPPRKAAVKPLPPAADLTPASLLDDLLGSPVILALFGGVVVVAGGVLMIYYRRRRRSIAEFEESILSGGGLNSESNPGASGAAGEVSLLSEFSQGGMGNIHTDEVDPIAEAEVYLAYGRDEQAEEILKEAVVKDPARHELRQKLLEIYHQRNDVGAFETVAEELYAALEGKGGKAWDRVEEMGRKMNPHNPLFRGGHPGPRGTPPAGATAQGAAAVPFFAAPRAPGEAFEFTAPDPRQPEPLEPPAIATAGGLDFDPTAARTSNPAAPPPAPAGDFAFDLDLNATPAPAQSSGGLDAIAFEPSATRDTGEVSSGLDFGGLSLPETTSTDAGTIEFDGTFESNELAVELEGVPEGGENSIEWSLDTPAAGEGEAEISFDDTPEAEEAGIEVEGLVSSDEIATKLDLAKAYIDMGDAEGARSILDEVAAEGNELQKKQAAELAAQIS
jgi:pilus assembly protein FimV